MSKFSLKIILLLVLLLKYVSGTTATTCINGNKIESVGLFSSDTFSWTVGVPELYFRTTHECVDLEGCFSWRNAENSIGVEIEQTLGVEIEQTSDCSVTDSYDGMKANCTLITSPTQPKQATSTLSFGRTENSTALKVLDSKAQPCQEQHLSFSLCKDLYSNQNGLEVENGTGGRYWTEAIYKCTMWPSDLLVDGVNSTSNTYQRRCLANVSWDGSDDVQCQFAPEVVEVLQRSFYAGEAAKFSCNITDCYPPATKTNYIDSQVLKPGYLLKSSDHAKIYYCTASNEYSKRHNKQSQSGTKNMIVYFKPEKGDVGKENVAVKRNLTIQLMFSFSANYKKPSGDLVVTLSRPNGTSENLTSPVDTGSETSYVYIVNVTFESANDYGLYTFLARTSDPTGNTSASVNITESSGPANYALIGGVCGGVVFLLIVLLVAYFIVRRNRHKQPGEESVREERMNEIYGSAPRHTGDDESSHTREEKANVLYVSSGEAGGIEEAYAAVDKKGKKKSNGNDNSAYSPEIAEVTYAAVNKPKKNKKTEEPQEAVYSAVNKKKKKKDVDKEPGLHGSPTAGEA